jgi:prolyl-tRNA editing enzyme YbaK/EbsC (Cys-tRNA(Pro) deacylase)
MSGLTPVSKTLSEMGIPHREFQHPGPVLSLEQAAQERGQTPGQVIRSILFRVGKREFVMVLVAGPSQISWPDLRAHLNQSRLTMASNEEVLTATGYPPGAVSPFGLPSPLRILADEGVFLPKEISIGSGLRGIAIMMKSSYLKRALGEVEIGRFVPNQF